MKKKSMICLYATLVMGLLLMSCGDIYYNSNGETFRVPKQKRDQIFVDSQSLNAYAFDLNAFLQQDYSEASSIQYILPSDIQALVKETGELFIILYYPNCKGAEGYVELARQAEDMDVPVLLISIINNPEDMLKWYETKNLENK